MSIVNMGYMSIVDFLCLAGMVKSKGEARRLLTQGAVYDKTLDEKLEIGDNVYDGTIVKCGKRKWAKAIFSSGPFAEVELISEEEYERKAS